MTMHYINKDTGQPGIDPVTWVQSIADPADKANCIRIREEEGARYNANPDGTSNPEFQAMFDRYLAECNIRIEITAD